MGKSKVKAVLVYLKNGVGITQQDGGYEPSRCIQDNRRTSADEIACEMSISNGKKWVKIGLRPNRKHYILMQSVNLLIYGRNGLQSSAIMWRNEMCVITV
jgi:hypothetical protein